MLLETDLLQLINELAQANSRVANDLENIGLRRDVCAVSREAQDVFEEVSVWSGRTNLDLQRKLVEELRKARDLLEIKPRDEGDGKWRTYYDKLVKRVEEVERFDAINPPTAFAH